MSRPLFKSIVLIVATATTVTACSTSSSTATSSTSSGAASASAAVLDIPYDGPEENYPTVSRPQIKAGTNCKIGYQNPNGSVSALTAQQDAAEAEAKELGCEFIALDDLVNPTTQVNNFNQLVAQGVDVIVVFPFVAAALAPSLEKAKAAGIAVIGQNVPVAADQPTIAGYATNMLHMTDTEAYLRVKDVAERKPGASFAMIGFAAPVELFQYMEDRTKFWAEKFGLQFLGQVDAQQDNPAAHATAMTAILTQYPQVDAVFAYGDGPAVGAATVAKSSGRDIMISGGDGSQAAFEAIKDGRMTNSPQPDLVASGRMMTDAAYSLITQQNLPLPANMGVPVTLINQDNVGQATPIG